MGHKTTQSQKHYNQMAAEYDHTPDGKFTRAFKQCLKDAVHVPLQATVLDVACGNGTLLAMIHAKQPIKGFGVDISEAMIAQAKKRHEGFTFCVANSEQLPFDDGFFDCVTVSASFHHFERPGLFLQEAKRILKPGGALYIAEIYMPGVLLPLANVVLPLLQSGDVKLYSPKALSGLLQSSGFTDVNFWKAGNIQLATGIAP